MRPPCSYVPFFPDNMFCGISSYPRISRMSRFTLGTLEISICTCFRIIYFSRISGYTRFFQMSRFIRILFFTGLLSGRCGSPAALSREARRSGSSDLGGAPLQPSTYVARKHRLSNQSPGNLNLFSESFVVFHMILTGFT